MAESDRTTSVEYRTIGRFPGFRFGDDATVQTLWTMGVAPKIGETWRTIKADPRPTGFAWIYLGSRKTTKPYRLDELICEAFWGKRRPGTECVHADGNRTNCSAWNLGWGVTDINARDPNVRYLPIPGTEGYETGDDGTIWSAWGSGNDKPSDTWRRMTPTLLDSGHFQVHIKMDGESRKFGVHHLVCRTFRGPQPDGMECCHNDGQPWNNRADNLRWDTYAANMEDRRKHGVMVCGVEQWQAKLDDDKIRHIRESHASGRLTQMQLAELYGVSDTTISKIVRRITWKHVI